MATGDASGLNARVQDRIEQAIVNIRRENGLDVSVLVGDLDLSDVGDFRTGAELLHTALGVRAPQAVLLVVAPGQRKVAVVTGALVRQRVPDRVCALAVLSMTTAFSGADLAGGIIDGLRQIAQAAGVGEPLGELHEPVEQDAHHAPALMPVEHYEVVSTDHATATAEQQPEGMTPAEPAPAEH